MIKRLKAGIFQPKKIINYVNDRAGIKVCFFLIFCVVLVLPFITFTGITRGLTSYEKVNLQNSIRVYFKTDAKIENYELIYNDKIQLGAGNYLFTIGEYTELTSQTLKFSFEKGGIRVIAMDQLEVNYHTYESLGIKEHDFSEYNDENDEKLVFIFDKIIKQNQAVINTVYIAKQFFLIAFDYIITIIILLIMSLFMIRRIPFKLRFNISFYSSFIYVLISLLMILYGISLGYFGLVIAMVYQFIVYRNILVIIKNRKDDSNG